MQSKLAITSWPLAYVNVCGKGPLEEAQTASHSIPDRVKDKHLCQLNPILKGQVDILVSSEVCMYCV